MTDRAKFEQMLEFLINEDKTKAEELFHDIVVAKSREIYENLLDDDMEVESVEDLDDEEVSEEVSDEEAEDMLDDLDASDEDEEGDEGDETGDEGDEAATKDDLDLAKQDIIDALTAEFEASMGGESDEEPEMDDMGGEEEMEEPPVAEEDELVMEYTKPEKAAMGDNGDNTKSPVAGKNDMGGKAVDFTGEDSKSPATPSSKEDSAGNVNVPGGNAAKSMTSAKKASGGDDGANSKSTIGA
jgi:hypothetical protein